jgi:hypothetical protein
MKFSADPEAKTLTLYERENLSGHDAAIIRYDHMTVVVRKKLSVATQPPS